MLIFSMEVIWAGTSTCPKSSILSAVENASSDDEIIVHAGRYHENITIDNKDGLIVRAVGERVVLDGTQSISKILMQLGQLPMPMEFRKSLYLLTAGNYSLIGRNKFLHVGPMLDLQTIRYSTVHIGLEELSQVQTTLTQMVGYKMQAQKPAYMMVLMKQSTLQDLIQLVRLPF